MILIFDETSNLKYKVQLHLFDSFQIGDTISIQDSINAFVSVYNDNIPLLIGNFLIDNIIHVISENEHSEIIVTKNIYLTRI